MPEFKSRLALRDALNWAESNEETSIDLQGMNVWMSERMNVLHEKIKKNNKSSIDTGIRFKNIIRDKLFK